MHQGNNVYYLNQRDEEDAFEQDPFNEGSDQLIDEANALQKFKQFLPDFRTENIHKYFDMIFARKDQAKHFLEIEVGDINDYDQVLSSSLKQNPTKYLPIFEQGLHEYALNTAKVKENWQVQLISHETPMKLRDLRSAKLNQLITTEGIVVSVSSPYQRTKTLALQCKQCMDTQYLDMGTGMESAQIPRICQKNSTEDVGQDQCPKDPYVVVPEKCVVVDQQFCKIQESNENVPTGEIPRTFSITMDRFLIDKVVPGQQVKVTGIYKVQEQKKVNERGVGGLRLPYIQVLGIEKEKRSKKIHFSEQEVNDLKAFSRQPNFFEKISKNVAPSIYGRDNIKQAIACLMFGGSKKILPDKTKLRGDINVLLIGDPSTGKSQFLKFVHKISPVCVYTSGKGSSAAGLTASVVKNFQTGEFQIEGGAMVLADGGIVCIDEFDKMRAEDRVSIHEAMEQQTISVSKAGFTTKLNSRCSVLAAANPIFGSYSEGKDISEQIELQTTILSRFDCIFIVKDPKERDHDSRMVDHILNLHSNKEEVNAIDQTDLIDQKLFQRYVTYAKTQIDPRLSKESSQKIVNLYVNDREKAKEQGRDKSKKAHIPITVRQLEALIRLSESIAKMNLSEEVLPEHIDQAHKLFTESTMNAISGSGDSLGLVKDPETQKIILKIENAIKSLISINSKKKTSELKQSLMTQYKNESAIDHAFFNLIQKEEFRFFNGNQNIQRLM